MNGNGPADAFKKSGKYYKSLNKQLQYVSMIKMIIYHFYLESNRKSHERECYALIKFKNCDFVSLPLHFFWAFFEIFLSNKEIASSKIHCYFIVPV